MDEAFHAVDQIIEGMIGYRRPLVDDEAGVRSYVYAYEIEAPVELWVGRDEQGVLRIGSTPPLYYVDTSIRPAFHQLRFTAELDEAADGE